jgi:hypothetical protein
VISRTSAMTYKGVKNKSLPQIARELNSTIETAAGQRHGKGEGQNSKEDLWLTARPDRAECSLVQLRMEVRIAVSGFPIYASRLRCQHRLDCNALGVKDGRAFNVNC